MAILDDRVPLGAHWAIIGTQNVFIPGDERSRTAPGHGYPERTETYIVYEAFKDYATFELNLKRRLIRGDHVVGIEVGKTYTKNKYEVAINETPAKVPTTMNLML